MQSIPNYPNPPIGSPASSSPTCSTTTTTAAGSIIGKLEQQQEEKMDMEMKIMKMKVERERMEKMMMRQYVKKLALWFTRSFTPILSHDQLQPIMATLGFFPALPLISTTTSPPPPPNPNSNSNSAPVPVLWKEYYFYNYSPAGPPLHRNSESNVVPPAPPRPRLPYPNIDGLHFFTYRAFLDALSFYLPPFSNVSDIFHVRGMPLQPEDRNKMWRSMYENDLKFVHCEASFGLLSACNKNDQVKSSTESNSRNIRSKGELTPFGIFVPLDDIITRPTKLKTRRR